MAVPLRGGASVTNEGRLRMTGVLRVMRVMRVLRVLRVHLCVRVRVRLFLRLLQGVIAEEGQDQRRRRWLSQWHLLARAHWRTLGCLFLTAPAHMELS